MTNHARGAHYIGQTDDLFNRIWEHQAGIGSAFTRTYGCDRLVWFESYGSRLTAFNREQELQSMSQEDVARLIEQGNPDWRDLSSSLSAEAIFAAAQIVPIGAYEAPQLRL